MKIARADNTVRIVRYETGLFNENELNRTLRADLGLTPLRFIVTDNIPMAP